MTRVWLLLFLQLRLSREEAAYARKGRSRLLSCSLDRPLADGERLVWSFHRTNARDAVSLFLAEGGRAPERLGGAWGRLNLLQNHSLHLQAAEDGDTGSYWCSVQSVNRNIYELVVITGTQVLLTNLTCHLLSCAFSPPLGPAARQALEWLADGKPVTEAGGQGQYRLFWDSHVAMLQACGQRKEPSKPRRKKSQYACRIKDTTVTFDVAGLGAARAPPARDPEGPPCSSFWIPLAVCAALEFVLLVAMGVALWRQRRPQPRSQLGNRPTHPRPDPAGLKSQMQLYENVGPRSTGGANLAQP
ncbi:lymphocyte antigen 6 complex locus protein G6f-like isoform X1 [Pelodiscus sinensis]|uniref:lymphocyte antigen 6 complex locus protein G6f-like isoform X1 n=1 Tax=Pelodiscus sinensis TaxID=13735 RepID=UPI003F6BD614